MFEVRWVCGSFIKKIYKKMVVCGIENFLVLERVWIYFLFDGVVCEIGKMYFFFMNREVLYIGKICYLF